MTDPLLDRATGALLGLAIGDALGTTLEFKPRDSYPPLTDLIGGGPFDLPAGLWTDDTSMAFALADSLLTCGGLDPADLMRRFLSWWRTGEYSPTGTCFDIGITTRAALQRFERTGNPRAGDPDPMTAGNGSLMRLAPIAIWGVNGGDTAMRSAARVQSATTHAAPACLDACEAWAVMLATAIHGGDFGDALASARHLGMSEPIGPIIAGSWRGKRRAQIASTGYVAHSLEASLWCIAETDDFRDAVLLAANLGDDADTTAAITGQLAGALYAASGIPPEWRATVAWSTQITSVAAALLEQQGK